MKSCVIIIVILIIIFVLILFMNNNQSIITEHMSNLPHRGTCVNNKLPPGPWRLTCDKQYFSENGVVLNAECKNDQGTYTPTSIRLDKCVSDNCVMHNDNGQLQCGLTNQNHSCNKNNVGGSWNQTCINPQYIGDTILKADCQTTNGDYVQSHINIGSCAPSGCNIYNNNGKLQCTEPSQKCSLPKGSWKETCKNDIFNVTTGTLRAQCQTTNGSYVPSNININQCSSQNCEIYNNNGQLECGSNAPQPVSTSCPYPKGSWSQTCTDDFYDAYNNILYAQCQNVQGLYVPSRISIDSCANTQCNITNNNGILQCDNTIISPHSVAPPTNSPLPPTVAPTNSPLPPPIAPTNSPLPSPNGPSYCSFTPAPLNSPLSPPIVY